MNISIAHYQYCASTIKLVIGTSLIPLNSLFVLFPSLVCSDVHMHAVAGKMKLYRPVTRGVGAGG